MNNQQKRLVDGRLAVLGVVALFLVGCMTTVSTPEDYKQSIMAMQTAQTFNPEASDVPALESMRPIDGNYGRSVRDVYQEDVSKPREVRQDIFFSIDTGGN